MIVHNLDGCAPTPLAHYLKALGIFRLVAEQIDPGVRGWWEGERFRLASKLNRHELEVFFLEKYEPTPIVSPWNKGSGFFYLNDPGLAPVETSRASRTVLLQQGIRAARAQLPDLVNADLDVQRVKSEIADKNLTAAQRKLLKASPQYKKRLAEVEKTFTLCRADIIPRFRRAWRGPHREWMDAAIVLGDDGAPRFPSLMGTGGNDGRLDFTNNFLQRIHEVFDLSTEEGYPRSSAHGWLRGALWGATIPGCQIGSPVGQYHPGMAGGANNSNGPSGNSLLNPLDYILMMEGTVLFTAHSTRRLGIKEQTRAAAPFAVSAQSAGYSSAAEADESARGEQWMPLWSQPVTLTELRRLLAEGRAQIGVRSAQEPLDLARAVARLGSARGITAFQRYGYIERNGQSNLAIPLGRFRVPERASHDLSSLEDLDAWHGRLRREARAKHAPARLRLFARRLLDSLFAVTQHPAEPARWQEVLLSLADIEGILRTGSGSAVGPIPRLRPEWIKAADDGTAEFRLALTCALQAGEFRHNGIPLDPVRRHWVPLDGSRFATSGTGSQARIRTDPGVVLYGRKGIDDAIALVQRRIIEAGQHGERRLPLMAALRASAHPADLACLLTAGVDLDHTMQLARALMAIDSEQRAFNPRHAIPPTGDTYPDDAWLAVRLAQLPFPLPDGQRIGLDPAILRRLESGDLSSAAKIALQRLRAGGIKATLRFAAASPRITRLWAAALAFPINQNTAAGFLRRLESTI